MTEVYVIDDDAAMRDSLAFLMESAGFSIACFASAEAFVAILPAIEEGCVVTDVRMPGMDGFELLLRVRKEKPRLPVIVMTGHGDIPLAVQAMKLGAADFVEKPFEDERLIEGVRVALRFVAAPAVDEARVQALARIEMLSPRERQVMEGLAKGLSNKAIAKDYEISPRTVEVYRAHVMTKLQAGSLSDVVRIAIRSGLIPD
jgi:two-component system, LuxR family, response regulator FixJ